MGNFSKQAWQEENPLYYNAASGDQTRDLLHTKRQSRVSNRSATEEVFMYIECVV